MIAENIVPAWSPPFRGQIYDYARKLKLGPGYSVKGPVEIVQTLHHLVQPLRALRNPGTRLESIMGAVQTTKSLILDVIAPYRIEHDPGDCLWLLEDDPKAKEYADRCIRLIRSVPEIAALLGDVDRHEKTKTRLAFSHMKMLLGGLNPGNVQSLSWRYVNVDETWLHPFDGLIRQAIDRTRQYADTCKIILIGQGGVDQDDHDRIHKETDRRELHYACPACGLYQPFDLARVRPEDFKPADLPSAICHLPSPQPGTYSGLSWDTNDITKPNGRWNFEQVAKTAHYRCYWCDYRIEDTPEIRRQLHDTYAHFPAEASEDAKIEFARRAAELKTQDSGLRTQDSVSAINHLPSAISPAAQEAFEDLQEEMFPFGKKVGFHWPSEASMRLSFSGQVEKYLRAKQAADELAYKLPLQEFYQKDRGLPWTETVGNEWRSAAQEPYDIQSDWPDEAYRVLIADCQRDLKKFYYQVWALALSGEARQLERGTLDSFQAIADRQLHWKIKDQFVYLDCGFEMTKVLRECVKHGHVASLKVNGRVRKLWRSWTGLKGSGQELFPHLNRKSKTKEYRIYSVRNFYDVSVGTSERLPRAPWYEWSNLHCKDLLRARRDGEKSAPKFLTLPDPDPPTDLNSFTAQLHSEFREETYEGGRKRSIWRPVIKTRPNHHWDIGAMLMALMAILGIVGTGEATED